MIELRHASMDDSNQLFVWRNEASIRASSRNTEEVSLENHAAWMKAHVEHGFPWHLVMIAESGMRNIGVVRFHAVIAKGATKAFDVSIAVSPIYRGYGLGSEMLAKACAGLTPFALLAEIRKDNIASQTIFERCGFKNVGFNIDGNGSFFKYRKEPQP